MQALNVFSKVKGKTFNSNTKHLNVKSLLCSREHGAHHALSKFVPFSISKCSISINVHFKHIFQQKKICSSFRKNCSIFNKQMFYFNKMFSLSLFFSRKLCSIFCKSVLFSISKCSILKNVLLKLVFHQKICSIFDKHMFYLSN